MIADHTAQAKTIRSIVETLSEPNILGGVFCAMMDFAAISGAEDLRLRIIRLATADHELGCQQAGYYEPSIKDIERWQQGVIHTRDLPLFYYVRECFNIKMDTEESQIFANIFSYNNTVEKSSRAFVNKLNSARLPEVDSGRPAFADLLNQFLEATKIPKEDLALRLKLHPVIIDAFLNGTLVPLGRPLKRIADMFGIAENHPYAMENIAKVINSDLDNLAGGNPRRRLLLETLGATTVSIYKHQLLECLIGEGKIPLATFILSSRNGISKDSLDTINWRSKSLALQGKFSATHKDPEASKYLTVIANTLTRLCYGDEGNANIEEIIHSILCQRLYRPSVGSIIYDLVTNRAAEFTKQDGAGFRELGQELSKKWGMPLAKVCAEMGLSTSVLNSWRQRKIKSCGIETLDKIAEYGNLSFERKQDLHSLRYGIPAHGGVAKLLHDARDILNATEESTISLDNVVYKRIQDMRRSSAAVAAKTNRQLVPNALFALLMERSGYKKLNDGKILGVFKCHDDFKLVLNGTIPLFLYEGVNKRQFKIALSSIKAVGEKFIEPGPAAIRLSLALIGVGSYFEPCELVQKVKKKEITAAKMVQILRQQSFISQDDLDKAIQHTGNADLITSVEATGANITNLVTAQNLANYFYNNYPECPTKADFIKIVQGTYIYTDLAQIKDIIKTAYTTFHTTRTKTMADVMSAACELLSGGVATDLCALLSYTHPTKGIVKGISTAMFNGLKDGSQCRYPSVIDDLSTKLGLDSDSADMLRKMATQKVPKYDESLMAEITPDMSAQTMIRVLSKLQENSGLAHADIYTACACSHNTWAAIRETGLIAPRVLNRSALAGNIAEMLIPDDFPYYAVQRRALSTALESLKKAFSDRDDIIKR